MRTINISCPHPNPWWRQFPGEELVWGDWRFLFNAKNQDYDYFVVYDDLKAPQKLRCKTQNTLHLATEPPTFHKYSEDFLEQFAWVVTHDVTVSHPGRILGQPAITWELGWQRGSVAPETTMSFSELQGLFDKPKSKLISIISSNKTLSTDHVKRFQFAKKIKEHYGDKIDFFGRGFAPMKDKLEALGAYRFNIVLENTNIDHWFTEKFTDCVIAGTYPIYYGCPNLDQYFPKNSYTRIDIDDFESAIKIIDTAIKEEFDKKYRTELREARDLAMQKHNLFPMLIELITNIENGTYGPPITPKRYSKKMLPLGPSRYKLRFLHKHIFNPKKRMVELFRKISRIFV